MADCPKQIWIPGHRILKSQHLRKVLLTEGGTEAAILSRIKTRYFRDGNTAS